MSLFFVVFCIANGPFNNTCERSNEKNNNLGSRPGLTKTGLYSHKRSMNIQIKE